MKEEWSNTKKGWGLYTDSVPVPGLGLAFFTI